MTGHSSSSQGLIFWQGIKHVTTLLLHYVASMYVLRTGRGGGLIQWLVVGEGCPEAPKVETPVVSSPVPSLPFGLNEHLPFPTWITLFSFAVSNIPRNKNAENTLQTVAEDNRRFPMTFKAEMRSHGHFRNSSGFCGE